MIIKVMFPNEHWRDCGHVQGMIREAELLSGYKAASFSFYDDELSLLGGKLRYTLETQGHTVTFWRTQSRGNGMVCQTPDADDVFSDALELCRSKFVKWCVDAGKAELVRQAEEVEL